MNLLPKDIEELIPSLYSTEDIPTSDKVVKVKYFSPYNGWTWYVVEGEREGDDFTFFGLVDGFEREWGYFTLSELEGATAMKGHLPLVERDLYFEETKISELEG